jgi:hypothetical protein
MSIWFLYNTLGLQSCGIIFLYNSWSSRNRSGSFGFADAPGAWPWDLPTGFEVIDMECAPSISPPASGTIKGYHLLSENVKFHIGHYRYSSLIDTPARLCYLF